MMQTGAEHDSEYRIDYEQYIARGRGEDRQRVIDLMEYRFAEAPNMDDTVRSEALRRGIYDLPMVWRCRDIARFLGGDHSGKRDSTQRQPEGD